MNVLVVDVGGTHVKILATGKAEHREFPSGPALTAEQMVRGVKDLAADWKYEVVSIGYPGSVLHGPGHPPAPGRGRRGRCLEDRRTRPSRGLREDRGRRPAERTGRRWAALSWDAAKTTRRCASGWRRQRPSPVSSASPSVVRPSGTRSLTRGRRRQHGRPR